MKLKHLYKRKQAMKLDKLIKQIKKTLSLDSEELENKSKKKSIGIILTKLNKRKKKLKKELKEKLTNKEKETLKEQLLLVKFQIKKMEKELDKKD